MNRAHRHHRHPRTLPSASRSPRTVRLPRILLCHGTHQHVLRSRVLHGGLHRDAKNACFSFLRWSRRLLRTKSWTGDGVATKPGDKQGLRDNTSTTQASAALPKKKVCHAATTAMIARVQCLVLYF